MKNNPTQFQDILNQSSSLNMLTSTHNENLTSYDMSDIDEIPIAGVTKLTQILAIMGICVSIVGIIGNFFSIIVLTRKSMKKLSTYSYLLGLSICDEISLIFTVYILLQYCLPMVKISQSFTSNHRMTLIYVIPISASTQALSVWITMAYTFDRYLYVCHPYYGRQFCTRKRACIVLVSLFLFAFIYSIPAFLERENITYEIEGESHTFQSLTKIGRNHYFINIYHIFLYCTFVVFIPFTTIVILNGFLVYDIIKSNRRHRGLSLNYRPSVSSPSPLANGTALNGNLLSTRNNQNKNKNHNSCLKCIFKRKLNQSSNIKLTDITQKASLEPCITLAIPNHSQAQQNHRLSYDKYFTLRNDVTIMLIGLIVVFLVCHLPSTILRLITFGNLKIITNINYYSSLDVSNFLIVTNSTLNCIMYVMLGKKFRKEFLVTFISNCCHRTNNNDDFYSNNNRPTRPSISTNVNLLNHT